MLTAIILVVVVLVVVIIGGAAMFEGPNGPQEYNHSDDGED